MGPAGFSAGGPGYGWARSTRTDTRTSTEGTALAPMASTDAVVIGAGPNGLVAANLLADAGWDVVVLESQADIGGAVHSDSSVHEGYVHDTFSSFYPLAAGSPTIQALRLEQHGLEWTHAPSVVGTPFSDGSWAVLHRDRDETAAGLDALMPGDGDAWLAMCRSWDRIGDQVVGALLSPFPPVKHGLGALAKLRAVGGLSFVRMLLAPARTVADQHFRGNGPKMLLAGNAAHADVSMDAPGSAVMGWLLIMLGQHLGYPVPRGGAGMLAQAMGRRFESCGGEIRTSTRAVEVLVRDGRATAVRTEHGDVIEARHAVVADVAAPSLYGDLVRWQDLPSRLRAKMGRFEWDPGTVKVDWALDSGIPWTNGPAKTPGTVHLAESVDELATAQHQINCHEIPARPFMLVGQMASADATRAPRGGEAVWAYTHVPHRTDRDAGEEGIRGVWDHDDAERMADRMQRKVEEYAPGFGDRVVARRVLGPRQMQDRDENLVDGALNGGTSNLQQELVFRPVPGLGRAETPIKNLYLGSAAAHPGGGVHGACGSNAARAALAHARVRRLLPGGRPTDRTPDQKKVST
ncbi:MAG TPA: NAD(P)/FAD-dependent oxidoreductase [Nocardioidaceae bacterium]|nr:NAD(P)/FAD-dependent oxidoreductase [Nocardioidaceae bacterium]